MVAQADRVARAWEVLGTVLDPEVPAVSVRDLGIVRDVIDHGEELEVVLTPTYSGCPATEVIEASARYGHQAKRIPKGLVVARARGGTDGERIGNRRDACGRISNEPRYT